MEHLLRNQIYKLLGGFIRLAILGSDTVKRFKYCTEEELTNAFNNYRYGGKTNLIYVWINDTYVETLEVFPHDIHMLIFKNADEMYEWFKASGTPLIKDFMKGQQTELF